MLFLCHKSLSNCLKGWLTWVRTSSCQPSSNIQRININLHISINMCANGSCLTHVSNVPTWNLNGNVWKVHCGGTSNVKRVFSPGYKGDPKSFDQLHLSRPEIDLFRLCDTVPKVTSVSASFRPVLWWLWTCVYFSFVSAIQFCSI